jgi:hypothetical protein
VGRRWSELDGNGNIGKRRAHMSVKEQMQWRIGEGIWRRPTLECVLACVRYGICGTRQEPWQQVWCDCEVAGVRRRPQLGLTGPQHSSARVVR